MADFMRSLRGRTGIAWEVTVFFALNARYSFTQEVFDSRMTEGEEASGISDADDSDEGYGFLADFGLIF